MSIEEKYDEIKALIAMGKEKGYLLYEEINELLPADVTSAEELDDLFSAFGAAGCPAGHLGPEPDAPCVRAAGRD